ncbi:glycosyltransferase involved in cell wall biosynthesis [Sphingopyxis sp. OAS728]|uniref:glycosyltransferase family 2 protein n=1 Tax=Sphingopyxis sp. OAS728 TaxID=2663823 RepID=UPI00178B4A33|nr:glycosyltransferase family 2 protein [Sphingopyxis sp. OAS728]MBE1526383.1 glycosyltransferase involved in cell wall biosynthesis [Sphingopyxis sp. OAS728]
MNDGAKLGLVAIGRNEGERLKRCLGSVDQQIPIVYVDSASTDDSVVFARSIGVHVVQLDLAKPFTAARARNAGFEAILGISPAVEFIQFVDGDCELEPGWLAAADMFLRSEPSAAAVCGRRRERYPERSIYNRMCDGEWDTPIGEADACGGDAMFRVEALAQARGYDPELIAGEEPELCFRLRGAGWGVWRIDRPMTIHDADMHRARQWWMRAVRSGFGYAQVWLKTRGASISPLYGRQVASALGWTIGVALAAIVLLFAVGPLSAAAPPLLWLVQLARLSIRGGITWGWHMLFGKFAETIGILRFAASWIAGKKQGAILYK